MLFTTTILISITTVIQYIYKHKTQANSVVSDTNGLLISDFGSWQHKVRDTILTMLTPSRCTAHLVIFKISVSRDSKNPTTCLNGRDSILFLHGPLSTFFFSKSSNSQDHLFRGWRHPHSCPISCLGVYYGNGDCYILCAWA